MVKEEFDFEEKLFLDKLKSAMKIVKKFQEENGVRLDNESIMKVASTLFIYHVENIRAKKLSNK